MFLTNLTSVYYYFFRFFSGPKFRYLNKRTWGRSIGFVARITENYY
jgi:hypothetical protein